MYDIHDIMLWSIPTVLVSGIFLDRFVETANQLPLILSGMLALSLTLWTLFFIKVER